MKANQYESTVGALLGGRQVLAARPTALAGLDLPFDGASGSDRFSNQAASYAMSGSDFKEALDAGRDVAGRLVAAVKKEPGGCLAMAMPFADCMRTLIGAKGELMFRRPVTNEELTQYLDVATKSQPQLGNDDAAALTFHAMLMSPSFLYRTELGQGGADPAGGLRLGPYEVASALSYSLTDGPPDEALWKAAASGALSSPEQIRDQVLRLVGGLADREPMVRFFREYLRLDKASTVAKDAKKFAFHKPELLEEDAELWVKDLLRNNGKSGLLKALLTDGTAFVRGATAPNYNLPASSSSAPQKTVLPAGQRAGILSQPAFLVAYSMPDENSPVQRGRFIAERFLCQDIPVIDIPPFEQVGPEVTLRQRLAEHSASPTCVVCHKFMDPLGLGLETYDHLGRHRTTEANRPVVSTGELYGTGNGDGPFNGPIELAQRLASSPAVAQCFTRHAFRYWMGRQDHESDGCAITAAQGAFEKDGNMADLLVSLFSSRAFLTRSAN